MWKVGAGWLPGGARRTAGAPTHSGAPLTRRKSVTIAGAVRSRGRKGLAPHLDLLRGALCHVPTRRAGAPRERAEGLARRRGLAHTTMASQGGGTCEMRGARKARAVPRLRRARVRDGGWPREDRGARGQTHRYPGV